MAPDEPASPDYKVYRSRRGALARLRPPRDLAALRPRRRQREPDLPGAPVERRRRLTPGRVAGAVALAILAWLVLSLVVFLISAQLKQGESPSAEQALSSNGSLLGGSTILVLGSDQRPPGSKEPGAGGASRSDSMLLLRASFGQVRRLSILRDSYARIPGDGSQKINAAYAIGGPGLTVKTVEDFLGNGLQVNHVVEVDFANFPRFIDAMGGIDVTLKHCVRSQPFGGKRVKLSAGDHHLDGEEALRYSRVRKNRCAPNEDDRARAARQQQVVAAIRSRLLSPAAFVRLPYIAWEAPRAIKTDMAGPGLLGLFVDVLTGGSGKTNVLRPSGVGPGDSLIVSPEERAAGVQALTGR